MAMDVESDRNVRFDEFLMLRPDEAEAVGDCLAPIIDRERLRARKARETESFNRTVGLVVANALVGGDQGVHYSRRDETYSGASPYKPAWLGSKRLRGVIDGLEKGSLVGALQGQWAGVFADGRGRESTFTATPALIEELKGLDIDRQSVRRDSANAPVIVLKDKGGCPIRYDPQDARITQSIEELRSLNAYLADQNISLRGDGKTPKFRDLTRFFNGGSWDLGGRHFGPWWQRESKVKRSDILINGQETAELDFGGFFPRALHHLSGQELRGDPYDIPKIKHLLEGVGVDWETKGRAAVKTMVNIAISAKSKMALFGKDAEVKLGLPDFIVEQCLAAIIEHHNAIKGHLLRGRSLELMNIESDICQRVMVEGMRDNVVILPIFDSFRVDKNKEDYLRQSMEAAYKERVGYRPEIH